MDITTLHLLALLITAPIVLYADHMGFRYFTGRDPILDRQKVVWTHRLVFLGLGILMLTGVFLTVPAWDVWFSKPAFYAKLAFVVTLLMNGLFIQGLMHSATEMPYASLSKSQKATLLLSGGISAACWIGTVVIAFFFL